MAGRARKYTVPMMFKALRVFARARNEALEEGFTDNGGAIHSVERIADLLGIMINYPQLSHLNSLKQDPDAEITEAAHHARQLGEPIKIEHVAPKRAFAVSLIELIDQGKTDIELERYICERFRLVLTTEEEARQINKINRSKMTPDRISEAGLSLFR